MLPTKLLLSRYIASLYITGLGVLAALGMSKQQRLWSIDQESKGLGERERQAGKGQDG